MCEQDSMELSTQIGCQEAIRALTEKPILATSAERICILNDIKTTYDHLSQPLRLPQLTPEQYRNLRVRITGYSAVFVDMCKKAQEEIIRRDEVS